MTNDLKIHPWDSHNQQLLGNVHPSDWTDPDPAACYNLVVVGAGTAGLVSAIGAAGLGARVALVEKHLMGGDCLNVGCVPSKALIRSSRAAADVRDASRLGIGVSDGPKVDFAGVMERMRRLRAGISRHDSARRFRENGVDVFLGNASFGGPDHVVVNGKTLWFKRAVIATGARAVHPSIEGLAEAGFYTNESIFELTECPRRLVVIGGGPIGCELAQAFHRLGSEVTIVQKGKTLVPKEDPEAADLLRDIFVREGVKVMLGTEIRRVTVSGSVRTVHVEHQGSIEEVACDAILAGAGRAPNVEGLNLEAAGVEYDPKTGVRVNDNLQTTNPSIYAAGDICLSAKFTHAADASARIVIQNALFFGRKNFSSLTIPRCTYTDPEIAHAGIGPAEADAQGLRVDTFVRHLKDVDRAITDGETEGFVKVHVQKGTDRILGATIVARHAGEMIGEISLAMSAKIGLGRISNVIHPYPTQAEAIRQVADAYNRTRLTLRAKKLLSALLSWRRK